MATNRTRAVLSAADDAKATSSWAAMYNAFQQALGVGNNNFQLITPMQEWNWPVANPGQTASQQQSFVDAMPIWSPVGVYQSGSSFSQAYQTWLNTLIVQAPASLQNMITNQQNVLQTATNKYQSDYAAAMTAYQNQVKNNNPDFMTWLNSPAGFGYQLTLNADVTNANKQQQIYNALVAQADDKIIQAAQTAFASPTYYTNVVTSTATSPIQAPGYGQITSYAEWLTQQAGTAPTTVTWNNDQNTSQFNNSWATGSAKVSYAFVSAYVNGSWERLTSMESDSSISFSMTMNPMGVIPVSPLGWYMESVIRAKVNDPSSYRPGYTPTRPSSGQGSWILGQGGVLPARITDFLVCYQPTLSIQSSAGFSSSEFEDLQVAGGLKIGPFTLGGEGGTSSSMKVTKSDSNTFSVQSTSQFPMIFGIYLEVFGQE